jgi:hypothetical protein
MLKNSPEKIAIPLQIIFNKSLRQCKYPPIWKNAHVTAMFKKGDTSLPSNYRPISLISNGKDYIQTCIQPFNAKQAYLPVPIWCFA